MSEKYAYSVDGGEYYIGSFPTRKEAIEEALANGYLVFYTGQLYVPSRAVNAHDVIENVSLLTTEEAGDWADGYLCGIKQEIVDELQGLLQKAWDEWEAKHELEPDWYNITDAKKHDFRKE